MESFKYIVKGKVQGVGYRFFTALMGNKIGILGTVQNLENGDVEVYAQGTFENLKVFEKYLEIGPSTAHVTKIEKTATNLGDFKNFKAVY